LSPFEFVPQALERLQIPHHSRGNASRIALETVLLAQALLLRDDAELSAILLDGFRVLCAQVRLLQALGSISFDESRADHTHPRSLGHTPLFQSAREKGQVGRTCPWDISVAIAD
jgi:hypothetical protein